MPNSTSTTTPDIKVKKCAKCGDVIKDMPRQAKQCLKCYKKQYPHKFRPNFKLPKCETCGAQISGKNFTRTRFCSRECRRKGLYDYECQWCGKAFKGRSDTRYFCSIDCTNASRQFHKYGPQSSQWAPKWPDITRRQPMIEYLLSAIAESQPCKPRFVQIVCDICDSTYIWDKQVGGVPSKTCSDLCQRKAGKRRKLPRKYILNRDRYICQLCGKKIWKHVKWPHPKSAVIDHIIPLSRGGTDERSNLQAAHHECNEAKSNNQANDQLLLIG